MTIEEPVGKNGGGVSSQVRKAVKRHMGEQEEKLTRKDMESREQLE